MNWCHPATAVVSEVDAWISALIRGLFQDSALEMVALVVDPVETPDAALVAGFVEPFPSWDCSPLLGVEVC